MPSLKDIKVGKYEIDCGKSKLGFSCKKLGFIHITGVFERFHGEIEVTDEGKKVQASVESASFKTADKLRNQHMVQYSTYLGVEPDKKDPEGFPHMTFQSAETNYYKELGDTDFEVTGSLTICGVSVPWTMVCELMSISEDANVIEFRVVSDVDRMKFGKFSTGAPLHQIVSRMINTDFIIIARKME